MACSVRAPGAGGGVASPQAFIPNFAGVEMLFALRLMVENNGASCLTRRSHGDDETGGRSVKGGNGLEAT